MWGAEGCWWNANVDSWLPGGVAWGISHLGMSDCLVGRLVMVYTRSPGEGDWAEKFSSHVNLVPRNSAIRASLEKNPTIKQRSSSCACSRTIFLPAITSGLWVKPSHSPTAPRAMQHPRAQKSPSPMVQTPSLRAVGDGFVHADPQTFSTSSWTHKGQK